MTKLPTKLLEYLVKQCTKEVLDQITEGKKLDIKFAKEKKKEIPVKVKVPVDFKNKKFTPKIKKLSESDEPEGMPTPQSSALSVRPSQSVTPNEPDAADEPDMEEPTPKSGPVLINPRDKSQLQPVKFAGRDEASIERSLHQLAAGIAGPKVKISLGAKRMAREAASNPNAQIFFYLGKMDPESEEIFLMADKSMQIAKDDSILPTDIQGSASFTTTPATHDIDQMDDREFRAYKGQTIRGKDRHGLDEQTHSMIKKAILQILDRK